MAISIKVYITEFSFSSTGKVLPLTNVKIKIFSTSTYRISIKEMVRKYKFALEVWMTQGPYKAGRNYLDVYKVHS